MTSSPSGTRAPLTLADAEVAPIGAVHPSPNDWVDQVLYFLLPDRFSDGKEETRPLSDRNDRLKHHTTDKAHWMESAGKYLGGSLASIICKLDYLSNLGVTTLWIAPVFKQRADMNDYHGYGIQNFLDIDPRLGTRKQLRDLVDAAHAKGMYVLLDIVVNHTGNNFFYDHDGQPYDAEPYRHKPPYPVHGWRSKVGTSVKEIVDMEDGVWPREFQDLEWYTRAGSIRYWDDPDRELHPGAEFRRGDFFWFKDLNLEKSEVLDAVIHVYQYWIAQSDCDGFRIDTVKHISPQVSAIFCHNIRSFARKLGKTNFLLLGEVTGNTRIARNYVEPEGPNLDAVLDIESAPLRIANVVKGLEAPAHFFDHFGSRDALGDIRVLGRHHVSVLDDHDMICKHPIARFSANNGSADGWAQVAHATGVQLTTPGIPCIYYGTEQAFDGNEGMHDRSIQPLDGGGMVPDATRYVREAMFGAAFGAFETCGAHFFDPKHPTYVRIAALAALRKRDDAIGKSLRLGQTFLREASVDDQHYGPTNPGEIVAWSRIHEGYAVIVALNTHGTDARGAWITIDRDLHPENSKLVVLYNGDWYRTDDARPASQQEHVVESRPDGRSVVRVELSPAGMVVMAQPSKSEGE